MKKETIKLRNSIVNNSYYYIYKNLEHKISLEELAHLNATSKYHYHRIIKEETGSTLFELITSIRLQKAASLLLTNKHSTISEIASLCGYMSHSSFIKAFKLRYKTTPTSWREGEYKIYSQELLKKFESSKDFSQIEPKIEVVKGLKCAYIRHKGYDKKIKEVWEKLYSIAYENNISNFKEIGLHHDNPTITPLEECSYVAAITIDKRISKIDTFDFPESLCAVFPLKGIYGDVLNLIRYVYHYWLPNSGYETKALPCFTIYEKNHFTTGFNEFNLKLYVPISVAY